MQHRSRSPLSALLFASLLSIAAFPACLADNPDPDAPTVRTAEAPMVGASYQITASTELSSEQQHAIAQFVEAQGLEVQQARFAVHQTEPGAPTVLEIELWAGELPGEELQATLTQTFAELADAQLVVTALEADDQGPGMDHGIEPGDDAETVRQKVIDDLRARGVEGEIEVTVTPTDDGHHEIEVEVHADQPAP